MFFGPIVSLEMITAARRARYFILRALYATLLLAIMWINYQSAITRSRMLTGAAGGEMTIQEVAAFSNSFFSTFTIVQLIAVLLLTPAMIAGSIAQERERRTIEYMFASMLSNSEIVMSKFLARTIHVATMLVVGLPMLGIAMLLGGVDPLMLLVVFAITIATLVAMASLSIATSVWAKRSRDAVSRTYVFMLLFLVLPPMLAQFVGVPWPWLSMIGEIAEPLAAINPFVVLTNVSSLPFRGGVANSPWPAVWPMLVAYFGFSVVALAWSIVSVRWAYRRSVSQGDRKRSGVKQRIWWRPKVGNEPMLWKELFASAAGFQLGWLGRIAVVLLFACAIVPAFYALYEDWRAHGDDTLQYAMIVGTLVECAALLVIAIRAAGAITSEKERDSWLSLVSTPLTGREIIWGKLVGSVYAARWLLLPLAIIWGLAIITHFEYLLAMPILAAAFGSIALAVSSVGISFSSWSRTSIRSMGATVGVVVFLGGGYLLCCVPFFAFGGSGEEFSLVACIPFLLAAPVVLWEEFKTAGPGHSNLVELMVIFVIGIIGYLVAGLVLTESVVADFDRRVGRPMRRMASWAETQSGANSKTAPRLDTASSAPPAAPSQVAGPTSSTPIIPPAAAEPDAQI